MTEQTITSASAGNNQLRRLYETAFPVEEQIPWNDMHLVDAMPLNFTAYSRNGSLLGFTIVYPAHRSTGSCISPCRSTCADRALGNRFSRDSSSDTKTTPTSSTWSRPNRSAQS